MNELLKENLGVVDTSLRFVLGAALLAVMMISSLVPTWVALAAVYPVITAIMAWDPVYAAVHTLRMSITSGHHKMKAIAVS